jgi:hypothetical protein
MVEYQEHHLGGGGCLFQVAFDQGARDPRSLVFRQEAVSATGIIHSTFSESVVGLVLAMPRRPAVPNRAAVPNSIEKTPKKVEPFQVTRRLNR